MASHSYITFRGVTAHLDVQMTLSHGIAPMQVMIRTPPLPNIDAGGTLSIRSGGNRIDFPNCRADRVDVSRNANGLMVWTLIILDRRWQWKECGQISGYYNVREGENADAATGIPKQIKKGTEKNLRELMKLCLQAMNEKGFDLSKVPDDVFPEVEWEYALPAEALAKLADTAKFRIVLNWRKNRVELWPDGQGQKLTTQGTMEYQLTFDPPERPDKLVFVGQRMLWETDLELEAIARDEKGNYWPLNDDKIPYRPNVTPIEKNHFWHFDGDFGNAIFDTPVVGIHGIKSYRELAKADVYRKYRIKTPFKIGKEEIKELERILPLLDTRLVTFTIGETTKPKEPVVWGGYHRDGYTPSIFQDLSNPVEQIDNQGNPLKDLTIEEGVQIDGKKGIITFDKPRYRYEQPAKGTLILTGNGSEEVKYRVHQPAQLWLRIAFGIREEKTRGWRHKEIERKSKEKKFGTQPRYLTAPDAVFRTIRTRDEMRDNKKEYEKIAKHYLDQAERQYETRDPCAATYAGIIPVVPDGAIQQITWSITESGATTRVSRNREEPVLGNTYEESRLYQGLREKLASDPGTSRAADDKAKRRPA